MNPKKRKSSIKIKPLKGQFFDIKAPARKKDMPIGSNSKGILLFVLLTFLVFIGLNISNIYMKGKEFAESNQAVALEGYSQLQKAIDYSRDGSYEKANTWFNEAEISFKKLYENTQTLTLESEGINTQSSIIDTANKLIESGIIIAELGGDLISFLESASEIPQVFIAQNLEGTSDVNLTDLIKKEKVNLDAIYKKVIELQQNITTLNDDLLPSELKVKLSIGQEQIGQILALLRELNINFDTLLTMLGDMVPHRYMVLMQNNHEIRATGGFIGSYMIIDVNDGAITKMEARDVYESDGQLTEVISSPPGINQVSERLYLRDANFSPDFPTSAKLIMWFLEHSNQPSVDTVIAIDQNVVEEILEITGPIHLEHFPFQIKPESFNNLISYYIEAKISQSSTPKQILFDFIPVFKEKLLTSDSILELKDSLITLAESHHIQAYSANSDIQGLIERLEIDGSIKKPNKNEDYLAVISSSVGGNKSDGFIDMEIDHHTKIEENGGITNILTISKEHTWDISDIPELNSLIERYGTGELDLDSLLFILGEGRNLDYMRIYVPRGSKLMNIEGIETVEITEDLGCTVFAFNYGPLEAGNAMKITLEYELPYELNFKSVDTYNLLIQKQAGASNIELNKTLEIEEGIYITKSSPPSTKPFSINPIIEKKLNSEFEFSTYIKQN